MKDNVIFVDTYVNTIQYSSPIVIEVSDEGILLDRMTGRVMLKKNGVVLDGVPSKLYVDTVR